MNRPVAFGYTGARLDFVLPGYALGNGYRVYLSSLMRFCAPDVMSPFDAGGVNLYAYCCGDPINRCDPSGHAPSYAAVRDALGVKLVDAIAARLARAADERSGTADSSTALDLANRPFDEAPGPSNRLTGARKRKAYRPEQAVPVPEVKRARQEQEAPAAPQIHRNAPAAPRTLADYVAQAQADVRLDPRAIVRRWRQRYPDADASVLSDKRRLAEFQTARLLEADGKVLDETQREELAERLGYASSRYDWLRSRVTGAEVTGARALPAQRDLLTSLFGQPWADGYLRGPL